ncbi:cytochrome c oxidase cbb3-type subunit 4 [Pigmentiphaga kullae]|uniref:Cytochrome c oxidase cbb3-type subunit 4 n=4 Tax=Alcaligenaceae TaxID=506 RepID=A0A4Q7NIF6_9BURK|nr:cytochrome c oxidase cbb3-type subunit 4 [Pigmentiphaga kullae]
MDMIAWMTSIATALALSTFLAIVAWAWSRARVEANRESAMLPFALPDESAVAAQGKDAGQ